MTFAALGLLCLSALLVIVSIDGSEGDRNPSFRRCSFECFEVKGCEASNTHDQRALSRKLNEMEDRGFSGKAFERVYKGWHRYSHMSCTDLCMSGCAYSMTQERIAANLRVHKYFGHWSFYRYFGCEEPASVIFSLGNAIPHIMRIWQQQIGPGMWPLSYSRCRLNTYKSAVSGASASCSSPCSSSRGGDSSSSSSYFLHHWDAAYPWVALAAWLASAMYHAKRTEESELLDLTTALVLLWYGLVITLRRLAGPRAKSSYVYAAFAVSLALLLRRLHAMVSGHISFGTHMLAAISVVVVSVALWAVWLFTSKDQFHVQNNKSSSGSGDERPPRLLVMHLFDYAGSWENKRRMAVFQVSFIAASMLELFDFPPLWGVADAHSLWHACTIPLGFLWYTFIDNDRDYFTSHQDHDQHRRVLLPGTEEAKAVTAKATTVVPVRARSKSKSKSRSRSNNKSNRKSESKSNAPSN